MTDRPSKVEYFLSVARAVASRGDCRRATVGCVLVNSDHHIVATGYNGTSHAGQQGCFEGNCPRGQLILEGAPEDQIAALDCDTVHAEINALRHLLEGQCPVFAAITRRPCDACRSALKSAGVKMFTYPHSGRILLERGGGHSVTVINPTQCFTEEPPCTS